MSTHTKGCTRPVPNGLDGDTYLGERVRMRCVSRDGTTSVECIRLSCTGTGRDGEWLRARRHGYFAAGRRTVEELAAVGMDLADFHEAGLAA